VGRSTPFWRCYCNEAVDWPDHIKVAVNLSPAQLNSRNLVSMVTAALNESGMSPQKLQLEITETVLLQNTFTTLATLHELRKMGVQIALDDFGTGYSSLDYLHSFPFDKIKVDRSFIQDLSNGAEPLEPERPERLFDILPTKPGVHALIFL
jgi:predicted signal transduction protein with EAL and GGDEF domain